MAGDGIASRDFASAAGLDDFPWRPDTSVDTLKPQKEQRFADRKGMVQVIMREMSGRMQWFTAQQLTKQHFREKQTGSWTEKTLNVPSGSALEGLSHGLQLFGFGA